MARSKFQPSPIPGPTSCSNCHWSLIGIRDIGLICNNPDCEQMGPQQWRDEKIEEARDTAQWLVAEAQYHQSEAETKLAQAPGE